MGVIKEGSISGVFPSNTGKFAVHYPGYPSSIERALETLGGNESILKARTSKSNSLKLRFRPEDPYSHPAVGKLQPCNNFLLKISKKKDKGVQKNGDIVLEDSLNSKQDDNSCKLNEGLGPSQEECESVSGPSEVETRLENGVEEQLSADIVAHVSEAYHFNGMVDYQYVLPVHADVNRRKKRNWDEVEPQLEKGGLIDVDQEDLMILVPPMFTTKDMPEQLALKHTVDPIARKRPAGRVRKIVEIGAEMEKCVFLDFGIKEIPKTVKWEKYIPKDSDQWRFQTAVCKLFDERPVWVKRSLVERLLDQGLTIEKKLFKSSLLIASYYFSNGPFLKFYIRKGYDPRSDPDSRIYQRTDFRVRPQLRRYCESKLAAGLTNRWEDICAFRVFPYNCQTSLQLFELKDDYIQQEIRKPATQESCNVQTGWFSSNVIDTLRLRVAQRFMSVYPEAGAESLLKSISKSFERSKRRQNVKDSGIGGKDKRAANKVAEASKSDDEKHGDEAEDEVDEEEEEEEMEDDNIEEEMVNAGTSSPYVDDSISKDFLMHLFDHFPATGGDDPFGEYQIYDQDSDGNFDDE